MVWEVLDALLQDRNRTRNITLFLMFIGLGIERRRICSRRGHPMDGFFACVCFMSNQELYDVICEYI